MGCPWQIPPPHRRGFGLMFQELALFPHQNVAENISFGLKMLSQSNEEIERRIDEILELIGLPGFQMRDVNTLSGGERQRVALARSLAPSPKLLMLDEPLGSLDRNLRESLIEDLKVILQTSDQTVLFVTHDQEEAFVLADRIVLINEGRMVQFDTPQNIYQDPASVFVANFIGLTNLIPAVQSHNSKDGYVDTPIGSLPVSNDVYGSHILLIRPEFVNTNGEGKLKISGIVTDKTFLGNRCRISVEINQYPLIFEFPSNINLPDTGEDVHLYFDPEQAIKALPDSS